MRVKDLLKLRLKPSHIVTLGFIVVIFIGSFFLSLPISGRAGVWLPYEDALLASVSAVCVTGFVNLPVADYTGFGQAVILILVQIGGLGIMTVTSFVMIVAGKKITLKDRIAMTEALNADSTKGVVRLVRNIIILTFGIELAGALIMLPVFCVRNGAAGIWQAVFTSVSAFCNSGFDIAGLGGFAGNPVIMLTMCVLIFLGGIGFLVIMDAVKCRGNVKKLSLHSRLALIMSAVLTVAGFAVFFTAEFNNPQTLGGHSAGYKTLAALFESVNMRTSGFVVLNEAALTAPSHFMRVILMFIGASPGGTGGGIKNTTFAVLILTLWAFLRKRREVTAGRRTISQRTVLKALSVFMVTLIAISLTAFALMITEGGSLQSSDILRVSTGAFTTAGAYGWLIPSFSAAGKAVLMLSMFIGRVGLVNIGLLFFMENREDLIKYPEGNIIVG